MEKEKGVVLHEITIKMLSALASIKSELLSEREMMHIVYLLNQCLPNFFSLVPPWFSAQFPAPPPFFLSEKNIRHKIFISKLK